MIRLFSILLLSEMFLVSAAGRSPLCVMHRAAAQFRLQRFLPTVPFSPLLKRYQTFLLARRASDGQLVAVIGTHITASHNKLQAALERKCECSVSLVAGGELEVGWLGRIRAITNESKLVNDTMADKNNPVLFFEFLREIDPSLLSANPELLSTQSLVGKHRDSELNIQGDDNFRHAIANVITPAFGALQLIDRQAQPLDSILKQKESFDSVKLFLRKLQEEGLIQGAKERSATNEREFKIIPLAELLKEVDALMTADYWTKADALERTQKLYSRLDNILSQWRNFELKDEHLYFING